VVPPAQIDNTHVRPLEAQLVHCAPDVPHASLAAPETHCPPAVQHPEHVVVEHTFCTWPQPTTPSSTTNRAIRMRGLSLARCRS
jgi:hypothetical protein